MVGPFNVSGVAAEKFNTLVHQIRLDSPHIDADVISSLARWLDSHSAETREGLLQSRLALIMDVEKMRADPDWSLDPAQVFRIELIRGYVGAERDLIPADLPVYGHLDDALLLELAWPVLADDVEDYREFSHYRNDAAAGSDRPVCEADWLRDCAEQASLWKHSHRVRECHYIEYGAPREYFRVR